MGGNGVHHGHFLTGHQDAARHERDDRGAVRDLGDLGQVTQRRRYEIFRHIVEDKRGRAADAESVFRNEKVAAAGRRSQGLVHERGQYMDMPAAFVEGGQPGVFENTPNVFIPTMHAGFFQDRQGIRVDPVGPGGVDQRLRR